MFKLFNCISGLQKGPAERGHVKKRQKSSKSVKKFFDTFRQFSRRAKNVKNRQKTSNFFRHFSTIFARHLFSDPFWGALITQGKSRSDFQSPKIGKQTERGPPRDRPRERPTRLISLFSALQGLPRNLPRNVPRRRPTEVPTKASSQVVEVHLFCFHLFCSRRPQECFTHPEGLAISPRDGDRWRLRLFLRG